MVTQFDQDPLGLQEQIARIRMIGIEQDKRQVEIRKLMQDIKLATPKMFFQDALALAALIGAGAALAKLFS